VIITSITVFFFFQAEDGIRDRTVTGVQTCALPISIRAGGLRQRKGIADRSRCHADRWASLSFRTVSTSYKSLVPLEAHVPKAQRSEERRVGKECRSRCAW